MLLQNLPYVGLKLFTGARWNTVGSNFHFVKSIPYIFFPIIIVYFKITIKHFLKMRNEYSIEIR